VTNFAFILWTRWFLSLFSSIQIKWYVPLVTIVTKLVAHIEILYGALGAFLDVCIKFLFIIYIYIYIYISLVYVCVLWIYWCWFLKGLYPMAFSMTNFHIDSNEIGKNNNSFFTCKFKRMVEKGKKYQNLINTIS
jgi:hypothetical protein